VSYRDDLDALQTRIDNLEQERGELVAKARDLAHTESRLEQLQSELKDLRGRLERRQLPLLDRARIASPCPAKWEDMRGDDRSRFCGKCDKHVYNVAAMPRLEAEVMLREAVDRSADMPCLRIFRRKDGTILTADCPVGAKRKRRRQLVAGTAISAGFGLTAAAMLTPTTGDVAVDRFEAGIDDEELVPTAGEPMVMGEATATPMAMGTSTVPTPPPPPPTPEIDDSLDEDGDF